MYGCFLSQSQADQTFWKAVRNSWTGTYHSGPLLAILPVTIIEYVHDDVFWKFYTSRCMLRYHWAHIELVHLKVKLNRIYLCVIVHYWYLSRYIHFNVFINHYFVPTVSSCVCSIRVYLAIICTLCGPEEVVMAPVCQKFINTKSAAKIIMDWQ